MEHKTGSAGFDVLLRDNQAKTGMVGNYGNDVFEKVGWGIHDDKAQTILARDRYSRVLQLFLEHGEDELEVMKLICGDNFEVIRVAATELSKEAPTKRARLEANFPSPSDYGKLTQRDVSILDHRHYAGSYSVSSRSGLHVSLQVEAFGHFIDQMNIEDAQINSKFYEVASSLMMEMSNVFKHENERVRTFLDEVNDLFPHCIQINRPPAVTDATMQVNIYGQMHSVLNWAFKCEMMKINSEPIAQNIGYFVHLQKQGQKDHSPMLLASVVGCHYFQVFGATWNGNTVCIDPLCSPVSLLYVPRDPNHGVSKTARLLSAMYSTVNELKRYYHRRSSIMAPTKGPYFCQDLDDVMKMKEANSKWLFKAKTQGKDVVVKFCRSYYGRDVHIFVAKLEKAPKLIHAEKLPGNWHVVVMEKVEGSRLTSPVNQDVKMDLKDTVSKMHNKGYVHGDLRPQSILVLQDHTICILDFDWAGKEGEVRYPRELNTLCNWHPDVECGGLIRKEHDLYQIDTLTTV